ncbi:acyl-ACP--UDP-N-acetylglucosamine O-acyltransferase [bacterium]|nr:MAG: acyl-ACP--UDP-N-acetylglucosamine O-acyltransferase [bacterium]
MALYSVSKKAKIGNNVTIGDFTVINDDVEIGNDVTIGTSVIIADGARIADGVKIHHGSAVSTIPQDLKFSGEHTTLEIGESTVVREFSMLNRGTKATGKTIIGKNCLLMAYSHVAHDCIVGDNVIFANCVNLGGHVTIDDWAILGGIIGVHQFCRVGKHVMVATQCKVVKDIPPYITAGNIPLRFEGLNVIGLKRRGFDADKIRDIEEAYHIIYSSGLNISDAVKEIKQEPILTNEVNEIIRFIETSERGIVKG